MAQETPTQEAVNATIGKAAAALGSASSFIAKHVHDRSIVVKSHRSPWVWIFNSLSTAGLEVPYVHFRDPGGSFNQEWKDYAIAQCIPTAVLLAIGVLICLYLLCNLCSGAAKAEGKRPSSGPLKFKACIGFIALWLFVGFAIGRGMYAFDMIYDSITGLQPDIDMIVGKVDHLQPPFFNTAMYLQNWEQSCIGWDKIEPLLSKNILELNKNITAKLQNVSYTLYTLDLTLLPIPGTIRTVRKTLDDFLSKYKWTIGCVCFSPTILASLLVGFIMFEVLFSGTSPRAARIANVLVFECGALPIIIVVLFMTIVASLVLFAGVAIGGFCAAPEVNTINLVSAMTQGTRNGNMTRIAEFYLTGEPASNIIVESLRKIENLLGPLSANMMFLGPALDMLGLLCKRIGGARLPPLLEEAIPDIEQIVPLAKRDSIFRRYNDIVNRGVCNQMVGTIGWYLVCTVFSGLILLPMIAVRSHKYLSEAAEEDRLRKGQDSERGSLLETQSKIPATKAEESSMYNCCGRSARPMVISPA